MNLIIVLVTKKQAQPTRGQWGYYIYVLFSVSLERKSGDLMRPIVLILWLWTSLLFKCPFVKNNFC